MWTMCKKCFLTCHSGLLNASRPVSTATPLCTDTTSTPPYQLIREWLLQITNYWVELQIPDSIKQPVLPIMQTQYGLFQGRLQTGFTLPSETRVTAAISTECMCTTVDHLATLGRFSPAPPSPSQSRALQAPHEAHVAVV